MRMVSLGKPPPSYCREVGLAVLMLNCSSYCCNANKCYSMSAVAHSARRRHTFNMLGGDERYHEGTGTRSAQIKNDDSMADCICLHADMSVLCLSSVLLGALIDFKTSFDRQEHLTVRACPTPPRGWAPFLSLPCSTPSAKSDVAGHGNGV